MLYSEKDIFTFELERKGWFDYCPVEGICDFKSDDCCLTHCKIIDNVNELIIVSVPNFNHPDRREDWGDDWNKLYITKIEKSLVWKYVNDFNDTRCIYKIDGTILDDECLLMLRGEIMLNVVTSSYKQCIEFLTNFNINDLDIS